MSKCILKIHFFFLPHFRKYSYAAIELQKKKVLISEKKSINKFFKSSEISTIESLSFKYSFRKKIVVFTPVDFTDDVANSMFKAGAGVIGDYSMCSFRIEGTGTYKPGSKSNPHSGKRGKLSQADEIRLEVECSEEILDEVIDAMLKAHPYEETAYEIYDFTKRQNVSDGSIVTLKKAIKYPELVIRINKKMSPDEAGSIYRGKSFKKIVTIDGMEDEKYIIKKQVKESRCSDIC